MNRYCLFIFLCIIFLDIFNVNVFAQNLSDKTNKSVKCAQGLTGANFSDIAQKLSFEESINIPDEHHKKQLLEVLLKNVDESKREQILRIGIIRDVQKQNELLLNVVGLDIPTINRIRSRGILNVHPIGHIKFTTLPPASSAQIRVSAVVSRVNANGYLENVIITKIEGKNVYVRLRKSTEESVISRSDVYQPIQVGQQIYYLDPIGIPIRTHIISIEEDGRVSIAYLGNVIKVSTDQLELKPRRAMSTGKQDFSRPIAERAVNDIQRIYLRMRRLYRYLHEEGRLSFEKSVISRDIIKSNNDLIQKLSVEMHRQGIVTRLELEPVEIVENRTDYILRLFIDGIHENGNKVMRSYLERAEMFGVPSIKVSLYSPVMNIEPTGSTSLITNEIELSIAFALAVLRKEENLDMEHELINAMLISDAYANKSFIYHTQFIAVSDRSKIDMYGESSDTSVVRPHSQNLSYQEIYTHTSDLVFLSSEPIKNRKQIIGKINLVKTINENAKRFVDHLLEGFDIDREIEDIKHHYIRGIDTQLQSLLNREVGLSPFINYWQEDSYGRIIGIRLPEQVKETLKYLIIDLSPSEMERLIENLPNNVPEAHVAFLKQNPTVDQILDYSVENPDSFLESLEKEAMFIRRAEASRILNQELKRQLEQIRDISIRISTRLARIDFVLEQIETAHHSSQAFIEAKNELLLIIRDIRIIVLKEL